MVYTPIFTDKQNVSDMTNGSVAVTDIKDVWMKYGENNVRRSLLSKGIDYTKLPGEDGTVNDWQNNTTLEEAATLSVLCYMSKIGVKGTIPISGPLVSASADGMSKAFGGSGSVSRKDVKSPFDWCEMAGQAIDELVAQYRAGFGSAKLEAPNIERSNQFYNREGYHYKRFPY